MINEVEILAPAGAREQLEAAVRSGADAVYLGYGSFNARRRAKNFTIEELRDAVEYCHQRGVSVHITLNTLLFDDELALAFKDAVDVYNAGVDAVIVQDLGLARLIHENLPGFSMHASTQLTVTNLDGAKFLESLGFTRVVLARELSLEEIRAITAEASLETEVFIHGALCMCVSGGCYLSSVLGQRSGNRGLCAQPCRLNFSLNGKEYALSLKDMCHIRYINDLKNAGVKSFKIEGRMKRPEYVAEAVRVCRRALSGVTFELDRLQAVFSRSGFTDGYITGKRSGLMFGHRQKDDVTAAQGVLREIENTYKSELASVPLWGEFTLKENTPAKFTVTDGVNSVAFAGEIPEKAQSRPLTREALQKQLDKTGGTPYYFAEIVISCDDGLILPVSAINGMRRNALEEISKKRSQLKRNAVTLDASQIVSAALSEIDSKRDKSKSVIRAENAKQLPKNDDGLAYCLPLEEINAEILAKYGTVYGEIPSLVFESDRKATASLLNEKARLGLRYAMCDNIGSVQMALEASLIPVCSWGLNILNSLSAQTLFDNGIENAVASFEINVRHYNKMRGKSLGLMGYGYLPLMRMRACPNKGEKGCGKCGGEGILTDRMGIKFRLACNKRKYTVLYNSLPLYVGDKGIEADFFMLYFTNETPERVQNIIENFTSAAPPDFERTNGLYFKNLL